MFIETPVTERFRITVLKNYTYLATKEGTPLLRLLDHILFGTAYDKDSSQLLMGGECLKVLRYGWGIKTKNFSATGFVAEFSSRVFPIEVGEHSWSDGKARVLASANIPDWLVEETAAVKASPVENRSTGFVSGQAISRPDRQALKLKAASDASKYVKGEIVQDVLRYLNGLDPCWFDLRDSFWGDAKRVAESIENPRAREHQLRILDLSRIDPQPVYKAVERTSRIYSAGPSFLGLKREVRRELTKGWVKIDLKNAQMNIVSKLWNAPVVREYIDRCPSGFWHDVASHIGVPLTDSVKEAIKDGTYAVLFGAGWGTATEQLNGVMNADQVSSFRSHPLIKGLMSFRDAQSQSIKLGAEIRDFYGNDLSLDRSLKGKDQAAAIRSALACQAQSYELPVLYPVIEYAISTQSSSSHLVVTGWLHDGIWVHCEDEDELSVHVARVQSLIHEASVHTLGFAIDADVELPSL